MKTKYISLIIIALAIFACGEDKTIDTSNTTVERILESQNLDSIKAKKQELNIKQQELNAQIALLNERITALDDNSKLPLITSITTKEEEFNHYIELQGNVTTKNVVTISSEFSGLLSQVYVKDGDYVRKGQLLAKIDDGGLSQQIAQMKIQRDLAKTTFDRQKRLWDQNIGSEIQYLEAKTNYESQSEAVNQMTQQLAKTKVTAPFAGSIDNIITEQGNLVAPGVPLMLLVNLDNMYIEADVPERYIADVTKGKVVEVEFPVLGKKINSTIRQSSNYINPSNRTYTIEVPVNAKDDNIKPNLTAKLNINDYTSSSAVLIPQNIISEDAEGEQYVFILNDIKNNIGTAKRVNITTGKTQNDIIEVLSGLEANMQIIKEGARSVKDGQRVRIDSAQ
ncbi:efflux RND transporter periplasmic adaptor subunit [Winogradskyella sp.]|uniref:efflux RND transporter periplasmic adaptor subunit n=1 Tax=Winogradskyella sp. TaxID=1883156 RepID=UPI003F6AA396